MAKVARMEGVFKPFTQNAGANARAGGGGASAAGSGSSGGYATPKQVAYIRRLAADRGLTEEHAIQTAIDAVTGDTTVLSQLSPGQASRIIEAWRA
jgi:hypothetical protein